MSEWWISAAKLDRKVQNKEICDVMVASSYKTYNVSNREDKCPTCDFPTNISMTRDAKNQVSVILTCVAAYMAAQVPYCPFLGTVHTTFWGENAKNLLRFVCLHLWACGA